MPGTARDSGWRVDLSVIVQLFFLGFTPILLVLSHRNIAGQLVFIGTAAAFYPGAWRALVQSVHPRVLTATSPAGVFLWLLLFCGYTALSILWTPVPDRWTWSLQLTLFFLLSSAMLWAALSVNRRDSQRLLYTYLIGVFIAVLVLGLESLTGGQLRDLIPPGGRADKEVIATARGAGLVTYFAIPVLVALVAGRASSSIDHRWQMAIALYSLLSIGIATFLLGISANILAFAGAIVAGAAAYCWPKAMLRAVIAGFVAFCLSVPFLTLILPPISELAAISELPTSWVQRLIAWRWASEHIFSEPASFIFGGGINYSWMLARTGEVVELSGSPVPLPMMPLHPHNLPLQLWLEFGLVGVLIICGALIQTLRYIVTSSFPRAANTCIVSLLVVAFVFALFETNLWTLWRLAAAVFGILGVILLFRQDSQNNHVRNMSQHLQGRA